MGRITPALMVCILTIGDKVAAKTKEQTRIILRKTALFWKLWRDFMQDEVIPALDDYEAEIRVGDPADYKLVMLRQVDDFRDLLNGTWDQVREFCAAVNMPLGDYAGSNAPSQSEAFNVSLFNDKLVEDGESVESTGVVKGALAPAIGNTGNGETVELHVDAAGFEMDSGHHETVEVACCTVQSDGQAAFNLTGGERKFDHASSQMGTGNSGNGNLYDYGAGKHEFSRSVQQVVTGIDQRLVAYHGGDARNMLVNGNLEADLLEGDEKVPGALILSNEANIQAEESTPILGLRSLKFIGNAAIEFTQNGDIVGRPQFTGVLVRRRGTMTGNFKLIYRSGPALSPTDHFTETVSIASLSADQVVRVKVPYTVPDSLGVNPRIVLQVDTAGGSGALEFDELIGGKLALFDTSRAIAVMQGTIPFRRRDRFTGATTVPDAGHIQRMMVEVFGRSVAHTTLGSYWTLS